VTTTQLLGNNLDLVFYSLGKSVNQKSAWATKWLSQKHTTTTDGTKQGGTTLPNWLPSIPIDISHSEQELFLKKHLVTGWKGDGLLSKDAIIIKNSLATLQDDALKQLAKLSSVTKSLKQAIFEEFIEYAHGNTLCFEHISDNEEFWSHLKDEKSTYRQELNEFQQQFCFRTVVIYFLKMRFTKALATALGVAISDETFANPATFWNRIFKEGGKSELKSQTFKPNRYSWYRPATNEHLSILAEKLVTITTTELTKIFTYIPSNTKAKSLDFITNDYSHALSHETFGLFANFLMKDFSNWLVNKIDTSLVNTHSHYEKKQNCKFIGDYTNSILLAHWITQENIIKNGSDDILIPQQSGNHSDIDKFSRVCQELHLMTVLAIGAIWNNTDPVKSICDAMKDGPRKVTNSKHHQQMTFLDDTSPEATSALYDKIVFTMSKVPKKNPHHLLMASIHRELMPLASDGTLIVLSNQKMFVPSQNKRVKQLLDEVNLLAQIDLSELKGKGELPSFIYIFNKDQRLISKDVVAESSTNSFKISGNLTTFGNFTKVITALNDFINNTRGYEYSIYQNRIDANIVLSYYQDAVVDGMLIHASSDENPNKITHPTFFNNITNNCIPIENFFIIEELDLNGTIVSDNDSFAAQLLGGKSSPHHRFNYVAIVDYRTSTDVKLNLIPASSYESYLHKYGNAFFKYFGLTPKVPSISINAFREFFSTEIGVQIIQLTLRGNSGLKSKLKSLLVPSFLIVTKELTSGPIIELMNLSENFDKFKSTKPITISGLVKEMISSQYIDGDAGTTSCIINVLTQLKIKVDQFLLEFESKTDKNIYELTKHSIDFNNPVVVDALKRTKTKSIYPNNEDVYIKFLTPSCELPLSNTTLYKNGDESYLTLHSGENEIIKIYSEISILEFISFILTKTKGINITSLIKGLSVPSASDFKEIVEAYTSVSTELLKLYNTLSENISTLFTSMINK